MDDDSEAKATDLRVEVTMLRTSMEVHEDPTGCESITMATLAL